VFSFSGKVIEILQSDAWLSGESPRRQAHYRSRTSLRFVSSDSSFFWKTSNARWKRNTSRQQSSL
ncbi:MAG: hypothetical protein AAGJ83_00690, partial [Planctomycetota bacterium]